MGLSHFNVRSIRNADGFKGLSVRRDAPMHIAVIAWLNFIMSLSLSFRRQSIEQLPLSSDAPAVCRVQSTPTATGCRRAATANASLGSYNIYYVKLCRASMILLHVND